MRAVSGWQASRLASWQADADALNAECELRNAEWGEEEVQAESRETKGEGFVRFSLTRREDRV